MFYIKHEIKHTGESSNEERVTARRRCQDRRDRSKENKMGRGEEGRKEEREEGGGEIGRERERGKANQPAVKPNSTTGSHHQSDHISRYVT